jgi:hypothetical protein
MRAPSDLESESMTRMPERFIAEYTEAANPGHRMDLKVMRSASRSETSSRLRAMHFASTGAVEVG